MRRTIKSLGPFPAKKRLRKADLDTGTLIWAEDMPPVLVTPEGKRVWLSPGPEPIGMVL
jgi:hypothetical protein